MAVTLKQNRSRLTGFLALFTVGLIGILANIPLIIRLVEPQLETAQLPLGTVLFATLLQSTILLVIAVAVGLYCAPRLGLTSHLIEAVRTGQPRWTALRRELPLAITLGVLTAAVALALETLARPFLAAELEALAQVFPRDLATTLAGIFYGGITEEVLVRWGLLSLLAWLGWRLFERSRSAPSSRLMWGVIVIVALLFGVGHLGAVAAVTPLTPLLIARTILLNAVVATAFGWLFWRRSLEAAMIAHASWHVVISLLALLGWVS